MTHPRKTLIASIVLALCSMSPIAFGQPKDSQTMGSSAGQAAPKVSKEDKAAAKQQRRASGADVTKEEMKNPSNEQTGGTVARKGDPKQTATKQDKEAARAQRRATGAEVTKGGMANPVNAQTGAAPARK